MAGDSNYPLQFKIIPFIIVIIIAISCSLAIFSRNRKVVKEFKMYRQYNIIIAIFLISLAVIRIFFLISDIERVEHGKTLLYSQIVYFGYIFLSLNFFLLIFYFDKYFLKTKKHILTKFFIGYSIPLAILIIISFLIFKEINSIRLWYYGGSFIFGFILIFTFFNIIRAVDIKTISTFIWGGIGIFIALIGAFLDSEFFYSMIYYDYPSLVVIPPILFIIGLILFTIHSDIGFKLFQEYYTSKQICMVHRGKIEGKVQMCPNCYIKYCSNCFTTVILKEGKCWTCNYEFTTEEIPMQPKTFAEPIDEKEHEINHNRKKIK